MGKEENKWKTNRKQRVLAILLSCFLALFAPTTLHSSIESTSYNVEAQTSSGTFALGFPFKLGINKTAYHVEQDLQLRLVGVTEDSRCPSDVQCVWEGQISILAELANISDGRLVGQLTLTKIGNGGGNHTLSGKTIDGYLVGLADVSPYPVSTKQIETSDYVATLIVLQADDANFQAIIPSSPVALDPESQSRLEKLRVGQRANLSMALHNNLPEEKGFVSILEVRGLDDSGITHFLAFQSGTVAESSWLDVGQSWTPNQSGTYQLRTFLLDSLDSPQIISPVKISEIAVEVQSGAGNGSDEDGTMAIGNATSIIEGNSQFALDFYAKVAADEDADGSGNVFFSPWSISTAFALVKEGARGKTAEEVESVFGFPSDENSRRASFEAVLRDLNDNSQGNYTLNAANSIWVKEGYQLSDDYARTARQYYDSEVSNIIFTTEEGRNRINDWVETKTNDKIKDLIPPGVLDDLTRLVITNAVHFKGAWVTQFDEGATAEEDFRGSEDRTVRVQMMKLEPSYFRYSETDQAQILELPYEGNKVSMLVLLPRQGTTLAVLEGSLSLDNLSMMRDNLRNQSVIVNIPRFKLETSYTLNEMLRDMGMPSAFDPDVADLSGMLAEPEELYIQAALHKAFVEVDEEGTEAAAATGVVIGTTSVQEYPVFKADHPFIFLIQDSETGNILFMGRVIDPLESP